MSYLFLLSGCAPTAQVAGSCESLPGVLFVLYAQPHPHTTLCSPARLHWPGMVPAGCLMWGRDSHVTRPAESLVGLPLATACDTPLRWS